MADKTPAKEKVADVPQLRVVVSEQFDKYQKGEIISGTAVVNAILNSDNAAHVRMIGG
jgi:hypothetical protein